MTLTPVATAESEAVVIRKGPSWMRMLLHDRFATAAACWLLLMALFVAFGPQLIGNAAGGVNLRARNLSPGNFDQGWLMVPE